MLLHYHSQVCRYPCADPKQCLQQMQQQYSQQMMPATGGYLPYGYLPQQPLYRGEDGMGYSYPVYPCAPGFAVSHSNHFEMSPSHQQFPPHHAVAFPSLAGSAGEPHENQQSSWHQHSHSGKNRQGASGKELSGAGAAGKPD